MPKRPTLTMPHPRFLVPGSRRAARIAPTVDALLDAVERGWIPNAEYEGHRFTLSSAYDEERGNVRGPSHDDLARDGFDLRSRAAKLLDEALPFEMRHVGTVGRRVAETRKAGLSPLAEGRAAEVEAFGERWAGVAGLLADVKPLAVKGRRVLDASERKTEARTLDHTGSCGCCERNVKLDRRMVVQHGFRIGDRERVGNCFGVGHPPDEVSPQALDAYRSTVDAALAAAEAWLARLRTSSPRLGWPPSARGSGKAVEAGDADYPSAHRYAVSAAEGEVKWQAATSKALARRRSAWTPRPLPDGDRAHLAREGDAPAPPGP